MCFVLMWMSTATLWANVVEHRQPVHLDESTWIPIGVYASSMIGTIVFIWKISALNTRRQIELDDLKNRLDRLNKILESNRDKPKG